MLESGIIINQTHFIFTKDYFLIMSCCTQWNKPHYRYIHALHWSD